MSVLPSLRSTISLLSSSSSRDAVPGRYIEEDMTTERRGRLNSLKVKDRRLGLKEGGFHCCRPGLHAANTNSLG